MMVVSKIGVEGVGWSLVMMSIMVMLGFVQNFSFFFVLSSPLPVPYSCMDRIAKNGNSALPKRYPVRFCLALSFLNTQRRLMRGWLVSKKPLLGSNKEDKYDSRTFPTLAFVS